MMIMLLDPFLASDPWNIPFDEWSRGQRSRTRQIITKYGQISCFNLTSFPPSKSYLLTYNYTSHTIVFPMTQEDSYWLLIQREKGRDLTQSYDKSPYTNKNVKRAKWQHNRSGQTLKVSIRCRGGMCPFKTGLVALYIIWSFLVA